MTDARDRLAQGLEILMARPYNYWHLKEAADAIAAFVEERIGERDVAILDQTGRDLGVRVDALTQRLEAVERETRVLREATGVEMNRTEEGTRWWVKGQPVPAPDREFQDKVERKFAEQIKDAGGQPDPTATFTCDDCGRRPTRIAFQLCDRCWERYERPV